MTRSNIIVGCNFTWTAPVPNPNEANSALTYYVHLGQLINQRQRVLGTLLAHIMSEPAFNILRTKEQLGYIVSCSRWTLSGDSQFGLRIVVQSERGTGYLEERVDAFLDTMESKLEEMDIEEFNDFKRGLQHRWREPPKNLGEEASKYWQQIDSGFLDFLRRELPRAYVCYGLSMTAHLQQLSRMLTSLITSKNMK